MWGPVTNPTAHALASWPCAPWGRQEKEVSLCNTATLLQTRYPKRDSALLAHAFNYRGISAYCLEPDHISTEKILKPQINDKHLNDLIADFQFGGTRGAGAFVTQVMELQEKLGMA